jgi:hypothetical protein
MRPQEPLKIVNTDRHNGDALYVGFSDGTTAVYSIEQITALKPKFISSPEDAQTIKAD